MIVPLKGIHAAEHPTLTVEAVEAKPGDEVRLAVSLSNNPGICAFRMAVNYDKGLTLTAVSDAKLYGDHMFGNDLNANPYILMWDESLKTRPNTNNGVLAYLTFKVDKDAVSGTHKVWITYNVGDIYDLDLKDIDVDLIEGNDAFKNLKRLKSITINSGKITEVRNGAFAGLSKKATIRIKANKTVYNNIVTLIKESGIGEKVIFKRKK